MKLIKQQRFTVDERNGCASIYEYQRTIGLLSKKDFYAVSIYLEGKSSFVNRTIASRAKAEKIYNSELGKLKVKM
jgi:hypothetical protein